MVYGNKYDTYRRYIQRIIMSVVKSHLSNAKIILFGSRVRGDASEDVDIDIALDVGSKIDAQKLHAIWLDLYSSNLPVKFDVVDVYTVSDRMRQEIMKNGIIWKN